MNRTALLLSLTLAASSAAAQEPAPAGVVPLTADEAVARAIAASPRLARLAAQKTAAEAQSRGARAERWPQVDVSAGYQYRSNVPELAIFAPTGDPSLPVQRIVVFPNINDNWSTRVGVVQPIYTGGRIRSGIDAAEQGRQAAEEDLRAGRADLVLETRTAYWSLVTARESQRVIQESIKAYDAHLADAHNRERFGMAARNEVLAVQVERDRAELEQISASAGAELAEANLQRLLDLPAGTRVETVETLAAPAPPPSDVEALVAEAGGARPDRRALAARVAAADAAAAGERAARLPQVAVSGTYNYANPNRDIVPPTTDWKQTWYLAAGVSWNVLDFGRRAASEARARAQTDASRAQLRELDHAIRLEVTQRALDLRTAEARLAVAERSVESAVENRRVAGDRYRAGVIPSSELLDAEIAHERASLSRTEAMAALRLAAAGLDRAVGR
jgi:outer membrane protein TolC